MLVHFILFSLITLILISFPVYYFRSTKSYLQCFLDYLNYQIITVLLSLIAVEIICIIRRDTNGLINISVLTAFIASFTINSTGTAISKLIKNRIEDNLKLSHDYDAIVKKYPGSKESFLKVDDTTLPVIKDFTWEDFTDVVIEDDNAKEYKISASDPRTSLIFPFRDELFLAHDTSNIYNQLNIRVDNWEVDTNSKSLKLWTSRTHYFASLVTNRAMDYLMKNHYCVREIMQPGPFVPTLSDSTLSNHLGFNAFVITSDGYIPFIKRNHKVSIAKNTYGSSVSASLKVAYALKSLETPFDKAGLERAILKELEDELKISSEPNPKDKHLLPAKVEFHIIAAYRDVVEGNKPQLLVLYTVNKTMTEITENFKRAIAAKNQMKAKRQLTKEEKEQEDGKTLLWFSKDSFMNIGIANNQFTGNALSKNKIRHYPTVPSTSASFYFLKEYFWSRS